MDDGVMRAIRSVREHFAVDEVIVFGSHGRGDAGPESDVDVLVVCHEPPDDPFEFSYEIRRYLHDQLDLALDVVVSSKDRFEIRRSQPWTIEHVAATEGVLVS